MGGESVASRPEWFVLSFVESRDEPRHSEALGSGFRGTPAWKRPGCDVRLFCRTRLT